MLLLTSGRKSRELNTHGRVGWDFLREIFLIIFDDATGDRDIDARFEVFAVFDGVVEVEFKESKSSDAENSKSAGEQEVASGSVVGRRFWRLGNT